MRKQQEQQSVYAHGGGGVTTQSEDQRRQEEAEIRRFAAATRCKVRSLSEDCQEAIAVRDAYPRDDDRRWGPLGDKQLSVQKRRDAMAGGQVLPLFAVVVHTTRRYGGPEEGGWYEDFCEVIEVRRAWGFRSLLKAVRELRASHETDRYGMSSCAGNGSDTDIVLVRYERTIESLDNTRDEREPWS